MYLSTFHNTPEDVDCKLCTQSVRGKGCVAKSCPWIAERIEAGVVGYAEAVRSLFPKEAHLGARLRTAVKSFFGSLYLSAAHRQRMERLQTEMGYRPKRDSNSFIAAVYLLTADEDLFRRCDKCFRRSALALDCAATRGISTRNYALLCAARDIYSGSTSLTLADLACKELVDKLAFRLILNATLIARYGSAVLGIRERSEP